VVLADATLTEWIGLIVLIASFVVACGVVWRAIVAIWKAIHRLEARIQRLHELTEPGDNEHGGIP
jgi:hypothetical protein